MSGSPQSPLNLVVLCPDEMRGDCAGFMGNKDIQTPHMDRLAESAVVFDRHFASFPKCVPARVSLMTGRYCHTDGLRSVSQQMPADQPDLLGRMREAGYQTAVFGKNHCWAQPVFDGLDFSSHKPPYQELTERYPGRISGETAPGGREPMPLEDGWHYIGNGSRHMRDEAYAEQAVDFLTKRRDATRPFFLQLNIESPHPDYGVEEPWFSMYDREAIGRWPHDVSAASYPRNVQREVRTGVEQPSGAARELQAVYYGMISKVDMLIGRVLDAIDEQGLWDNTVVLFWSDHGDYAGQYGLTEKWDTDFADCLLHVPCVLRAPGLPTGVRVGELCGTPDLAPTLLELIGLEPLPGMHGRSLVPVIEGRERRDAVFADGGHERAMIARYAARGHPRADNGKRLGKSETYYLHPDSMARAKMVRTDRHKLVVRLVGGNELYDLHDDPWEMNNRWGDPVLADVTAELMQKLVEWALRTDPDRPYLENFTV